MLTAVIMAGGGGERFWPVSRRERPKQLLSIGGKKSLVQQTVDRLLPLCGAGRIYIVTASHLHDEVRKQVPRVPQNHIMTEPEGKNTAPCIALAVAHLRAAGADDDLVMAVLPADHAVLDDEEFRRTLERASRLVREPDYRDCLVTIGVRPTRPETGYGYIHIVDLRELDGLRFYRVHRFVEKPDRRRAEAYLRSGDYLWNSGMFIWRLKTIERAFEKHLPEVAEAMSRIREAVGTPHYWRVLRQEYFRIPSISVDYGIMEKEERIICVPASFGWDDVGSWSALGRLLPADRAGNVIQSEYVGVDTSNCIVYSDTGRLVATVGLRDLVIVDTGDALLVCHKDSVQRVREVVARLRDDERYRHLLHDRSGQVYEVTATAGARGA
ncbi:MAG: mannose-phosphate guanylyltransferase [Bacillota bacterium]|nr:mannose-phosphate guanylyltransferase [Bacillota bacterium]